MKKIIVSEDLTKVAVALICSLMERGTDKFSFSDVINEMSNCRFLLYGEQMQHCHSRHEVRQGVRQAVTDLLRENYVRRADEGDEVYEVVEQSRLKARGGRDPLVFPDSQEGYQEIADVLLFHHKKLVFLPATKDKMLQTFRRLFDPRQWSRLKQRDPNFPWVL